MDFSWFEQVISQFHLMRPWWLLALLPLAGLWWLRWKEESSPVWQDSLPEHLRKALTVQEQGWTKLLPLKLLSVLIVLGTIICAGPTWQREASPFGEDKARLIVVLDASESMLEKDIAPSRLVRAKQKISDLITYRAGGETGLVVFGGSAHLAMPLTQDQQVFEPFLEAIDPTVIPVKGKKASKSIALVANQLGQSQGATVLLVTDGVDSQSHHPFVEYFEQSPHQLLILGVGDSTKNTQLPMDRRSLTSLASDANGKYLDITVDNSDVERVNTWIERNMQLNGDSAMPWQDMGYYLLFPLAVLFLLWFRRGWLVQWGFALVLVSSALIPNQSFAAVEIKAEQEVVTELTLAERAAQVWWDLWLTPDQQGQRWFEKKEYLEAAKHFKDPLHKGVAYYYGRDYKRAHTQFIALDSDLGRFYAATALARQREYVAARNLLAQMAEDESLDPELRPLVEQNLAAMRALVDNINQFTESQTGTPDGPEQTRELGDQPQTGDGVDEKTVEEAVQREQLDAEAILGSQELADKWLTRVQADPKRFLRTKFQLQELSGANQPPIESTENDLVGEE